MSAETLLVILVSVSALALTAQSFSMWRTARAVKELTGRLDQRSRELEHSARRVMEGAEEVVQSLAPLGTMAEDLRNNVDLISKIAAGRVQDLDLFVQEVTELGRQQASKVDYLVNDTAHKFEQTTEMIQEDLLKPVVEISSFLKGISVGISYLFGRKASSSSSRSQPEEELFI